ncbi:hypothetical protein [Domibacillus indicus]|uniref:hypothetical protein n=1 Tax=Domibacillus indicus TaxID=1437523 RepID=UPI000617E228|nr:hypothetical protein [Domibacillus indicus]
MIYPHILLILILVMAASISAADAAITKWKTADYLTGYYEMRIVELIALREVLEQPQPSAFVMETNKGITSVNITNISEKECQIRITITYKEGVSQAAYYYNVKSKTITKRVEYN